MSRQNYRKYRQHLDLLIWPERWPRSERVENMPYGQ